MINPKSPNYENVPTNPVRPKYGYQSTGRIEQPKITVVTPLAKYGQEMGPTYETLLAQSFQSWEWVIMKNNRRGEVAEPFPENALLEDERINVTEIEEDQNFGFTLNGMSLIGVEFMPGESSL